MTRRDFMHLAAALTPALLIPSAIVGAVGPSAASAATTSLTTAVPPREVAPGLLIHPRTTWAGKLRPKGPLKPETDVRFLLVHHSAGATSYRKNKVTTIIRSIYSFHTGPRKKWPDVCYNFFVDRYGGVWEGRAGSLDQAIRADATGGSQGFAQLVCLLGNFEKYSPTPAMIESTCRLLGWLGARHNIDLHQSHKVSFVSRGSNKWRRGVTVKTRPISGHRDMSATSCPGKNVYPLLASPIPAHALAYRQTLP